MRKVLVLLLLAALTGLLVLPVSAQESLPDWMEHTACEVDLTGSTIPIIHFGDISGSFAFITQPLLAGLTDASEYFNARGGICGAEITQENRDTGGDLANTQAAYDDFSSREPTPSLMVLYASADAELLRDQLTEDQIPALISAGSTDGLYGEDGQSPGWIYATNPLYVDQFGMFCEYIGGNAEQFPDPVVGYISWPGAFGEAAFTDETIAYCAEQGVTVLETNESFLPISTDITGQVQNLVDAGATILYTNTLASGPVAVARAVVDLGLEDSVQLAGVNWTLDTSVGLLSRTVLGADGLPAVDGLIGSMPFRWWTERDNPGIQLITEIADEKAVPPASRNIAYLLGWSIVDAYVEIYTQTANRVGGLEGVTGAEIQATLDAINYSPLGLYTLNWQNGELRADRMNRIAMMKFANADMSGVATDASDALTVPLEDGTTAFIPVIVPLGDFGEAPDLRPGGASVP
jgi:ABC-type branched-subunit amino acid transport system substrate-binding protein